MKKGFQNIFLLVVGCLIFSSHNFMSNAFMFRVGRDQPADICCSFSCILSSKKDPK